MSNIIIDKENYEKFILKGSLALELYFDIINDNKNLYEEYNKKLSEYRSLKLKSVESKEKIIKELIAVIEKVGIDNFIIYDDGDIVCNYKKIKEM